MSREPIFIGGFATWLRLDRVCEAVDSRQIFLGNGLPMKCERSTLAVATAKHTMIDRSTFGSGVFAVGWMLPGTEATHRRRLAHEVDRSATGSHTLRGGLVGEKNQFPIDVWFWCVRGRLDAARN
jgi:hypothetical protein